MPPPSTVRRSPQDATPAQQAFSFIEPAGFGAAVNPSAEICPCSELPSLRAPATLAAPTASDPVIAQAASPDPAPIATKAPRPANVPPNLAALLDWMARDDRFGGQQRADIKSALTTVGRVLNRPLTEIPTDPTELRSLLDGANPALALLTPMRWRRVRSLLLRALVDAGIEVMPSRADGGFTAEWQRYYERLPDKRSKVGLSRLLHFCRREGIEPADFDSAVFPRFHAALLSGSLRAKPEAAFRVTCRLWNIAVDSITGWPQIKVEVPVDARKYALSLDKFPVSFRDDVDRFLSETGDRDPFDEHYSPSIKPSTVAARRNQVMQIASALVASGTPAAEITGLTALVDPPNAKAALRFLRDRKGRKSTPFLGQQAQLLVTIGRHWVKLSESDVKILQGFASGLQPKRAGMVPRNRERLHQFDLDANVRALLLLPEKAMARVKRVKVPSRNEASKVMHAVAIELLLVAALRVDNLCGLDIKKHLIENHRGRTSSCHIRIPAAETKTGTLFERVLGGASFALLAAYLTTYRPLLAPSSDWLFPGREGGRRSTTAFSTSISKFIFRETGLRIHSHLFRAIAARLHLEGNPGEIETVRQILGHKLTSTTLRAYVEPNAAPAFKRWDQTLDTRRNEAAMAPVTRTSRRQPGAPK